MLKPIKTEGQYDESLAPIYNLMQKDLTKDSPESDELELLIILVKKYENEHYPMPSPNSL